MKIFIDLDQTLFYNDIIMDTIEELNLSFTREDVDDWEMSRLPKCCIDIILQKWKDPNYMCNPQYVKLINGVYDQLSYWKYLCHDLYCITSRDSIIANETKEMIKTMLPQISETIVVNGSKLEALQQHKPDLLIDDCHYHIMDAMKLGIKGIMISNRFTPYNFAYREIVGNWIEKVRNIEL